MTRPLALLLPGVLVLFVACQTPPPEEIFAPAEPVVPEQFQTMREIRHGTWHERRLQLFRAYSEDGSVSWTEWRAVGPWRPEKAEER